MDYRPTARRPIAQAFRRTAHAAVHWCVRHGVHPDSISRSAAAVVAYLTMTGQANVEESVAMIRRARPSVVIRPEILAALSNFERSQSRAPA